MKLGRQRKDHKGWAGLRIYANQTRGLLPSLQACVVAGAGTQLMIELMKLGRRLNNNHTLPGAGGLLDWTHRRPSYTSQIQAYINSILPVGRYINMDPSLT